MAMHTCLRWLILLMALAQAPAVEYFVDSATGSWMNPGTSESAPVDVLGSIDGDLVPGDTVTFLDGIQTESWRRLTATGTAANPILIRAKHPRQAILRCDPASPTTILQLNGVSYVTVEGLTLEGMSSNSNQIAGWGISIECGHHVAVRNCRVINAGSGGIGAMPYTWKNGVFLNGAADFLTFEDNDVSGCGFWDTYQTSGISIYQARSAGMGTAAGGFNIIVRRNRVWGCANKITTGGSTNPADFTPFNVTDGNGIIIDDFTNSQTTGQPSYPHQTLVENNLVVGNGGRGVHVFSTDHVTVRNNTCWGNSLLLPGNFKGELSNAWASDCHWYNNIGVATAASLAANGQGILYAGTSTGCTFANNLVIGPTYVPDSGAGILTQSEILAADITAADALFVSPGTNPLTADFRLQSGSPAVDAGDATSGRYALQDFLLVTRPQGAKPDLGAYERLVSGGGDTTPPTTPAAPSTTSTTSATPTLSVTTEAGATVRISDTGTLIATVTADGSAAWSYVVSPGLAAGAHVITVTASDAAGNTSGTSPATTITVAATTGGAIAASGSSGGGGCGLGGGSAMGLLLLGMLLAGRCRT